MLLERQFNSQRIDVKRMAVEAPEGAKFDLRREFKALESSGFYDERRKKWRWGVDNNQNPDRDRSYHGAPELLALFVEAQFQANDVREKYDRLKESPIYYMEKKLWRPQNPRTRRGAENYLYTREQLLNVLVELQFDKILANADHEELLENTAFVYQQRWYHNVVDRGFLGLSRPEGNYPRDQFLGVFVESFFDNKKGQENYAQLEQSNSRQKIGERLFWTWHFRDDGTPIIYSEDCLMGILARSRFDKIGAKAEYEALKETELFDKDKSQWIGNARIDNSVIVSNNFNRTSYVQLLDLLIRNELEKKDADFEKQTSSLPEVRKF